MSLPTWAKMPVVGATNPIRNSSTAFAGVIPKATIPPRSDRANRRSNVLVIALTPLLSCFPRRSGGHRCHLFHVFSVCRKPTSLSQSLRDAHQSHRQVEDRQHVDRAQHVLPPGNQRAEVLAQGEHDEGADDAADQRTRAAENR